MLLRLGSPADPLAVGEQVSYGTGCCPLGRGTYHLTMACVCGLSRSSQFRPPPAPIMATKPVESLGAVRIMFTSHTEVLGEGVRGLDQRGARERVACRGAHVPPHAAPPLVHAEVAERRGTNTFDRWEMGIHKRLVDLHSPPDVVKQVTSISIEPGVEVVVAIADA